LVNGNDVICKGDKANAKVNEVKVEEVFNRLEITNALDFMEVL